ncbi:MAG: PKD domain-containing protein [Bacteroidota bacterium]|nr:PKD domain-containing protein [Bacteroidota bacterium]
MRSKLFLSTLFFFLIFMQGKGQVAFQKTFGTALDEVTQKVIPDLKNGYCILGSVGGFISLNRVDSFGNMLWTKQYSIHCNISPQSVHFASFDKTLDNGFIICSADTSTFHGNYGYLLKTDSLGNPIWCKTYDSISSFYSVKRTFDGGYIIAGTKYTVGGKMMQIIQKTDSIGQIIWAKSVSTLPYNENGYDVIQLKSDSSFVMIGFSTATSAILFTKYSNSGINTAANAIFQHVPSNAYGVCDNVMHIVENYSGNINISESFGSTFAFVEVDTYGNVQWAKNFYLGPNGSDFSICRDGGFLITCYFDWNGSTPNSNIFVIKTDSIGQIKWKKSFGGVRNDFSNTIFEDKDRGIVIGGTTQNFNSGGLDYYLIKIDSTAGSACNDTTFNLQYTSYAMDPPNGFGQTVSSVNSNLTIRTISSSNITLGSYDACNCVSPTAGFSGPIPKYVYTPWGLMFQGYEFLDSSTWVNNWVWNFGDGTIDSVNINPIHNFSPPGNYNVCLTVKNNCGSDTFCQLFNSQTFNISEVNNNNFLINFYPNPFSNVTTLKTNLHLSNATLTIINSLGLQVKQIQNVNGDTIIISRDNLPNGLYVVRVTMGNKNLINSKIIIVDN